MKKFLLIACLAAAPGALAAPRIDVLAVKPNPAAFSGGKPPEVEVSVSIKRGQFDRGGCEALLDLGDGSRPRKLEFGLATVQTLRHAYKKDGSYRLSAKGAGGSACEGTREAMLTVKGEPKKAPAKKKPTPKKKGAAAPSSTKPRGS